MRLGLYGARNHRSRLLRPEPLTDEQLRAIEVPTHFVFGEKSEIFPVTATRRRAALVPAATTEVVRGAGHALAMSHVERLGPELARFLDRP